MSTDIEHRGSGARKAKKQKLAAITLASQSPEPNAGGSKYVVLVPPTESTSAESSEDEVYQDTVEYMPPSGEENGYTLIENTTAVVPAKEVSVKKEMPVKKVSNSTEAIAKKTPWQGNEPVQASTAARKTTSNKLPVVPLRLGSQQVITKKRFPIVTVARKSLPPPGKFTLSFFSSCGHILSSKKVV